MSPIGDALLEELHARSGAARWAVSKERFAQALQTSCRHRFGERSEGDEAAPAGAIEAYAVALHVEDLALACACRDGHAGAWEYFLADVLPRVRASARAMAGEIGVHLADDLLSDLYGVVERDGTRRPLFDYFHGRSRLATWLRTVLAQRHVDEIRAARRVVPLDAPGGTEPGRPPLRHERPGAAGTPPEVERDAVLAVDRRRVLAIFGNELEQAVARLPAADRLRLSYHYGQGLTLARIGRLMGEHESSVSRKLERSRQQLRSDVSRVLTEQHRFGPGDLRQCLDEAVAHGQIELGSLLAGKSGEG